MCTLQCISNRNLFYFIFQFIVFHQYVSAETGFFWHVTDFHYDPSYWTSQLSCFEKIAQPGVFGHPACDAPWRLVVDTVQSMAAIKPDVDFILWTGDSVAHLNDPDTSIAMNMHILENVTKLLNHSFPRPVNFYPSLGNHDFYPRNQADVEEDEIYLQTSDIWKQWIDSADQLKQFLQGGFYHKLIQPKLRLLALNTNLYYSNNKITKGMLDPAGQFHWMDEVLTQARLNGEKIVVTGHVPPGAGTPKMHDLVYPYHEEHLVQVLMKFSDIIVASHYGHAHADGFKLLQQTKNAENVIPQFVAPSVTPYQTRNSEKLTGAPHNPGIRLVEYDRFTGRHINYVQYYLDLSESNNNNKSSWAPLYSFTESYGVDDMSVESLQEIFTRMEMEGGEVLAQNYCNYYFVTRHKMPCPPRSRWAIICGGLIYKLKEAIECIDQHMSSGQEILLFQTIVGIFWLFLIVTITYLLFSIFLL